MIAWELIRIAAELCLESYNPSRCPEGFHEVGDLRWGKRKVGINGIETTFIITRGTANLLNAGRDIMVLPSFGCGGIMRGHLAHGGAVSGYQTLCAAGMPTAKGSENTWYIGHSYGGGVTRRASVHTGCPFITFGEMRTVSRLSFTTPITHGYRVVIKSDPVPYVPLIGYKHIDAALGLPDDNDSIIDVRDHSMKHYIAMIDLAMAMRRAGV